MSNSRPHKRMRPDGSNCRAAEPYGSPPNDERPTWKDRRDEERERLDINPLDSEQREVSAPTDRLEARTERTD